MWNNKAETIVKFEQIYAQHAKPTVESMQFGPYKQEACKNTKKNMTRKHCKVARKTHAESTHSRTNEACIERSESRCLAQPSEACSPEWMSCVGCAVVHNIKLNWRVEPILQLPPTHTGNSVFATSAWPNSLQLHREPTRVSPQDQRLRRRA